MAEALDAVSLVTSSGGVEAAIRALLAGRTAGGTICPSEAARVLAGPEGDWRGAMQHVHTAVDRMHSGGAIALSWKGKPLSAREGPYRIGLPE